MVLMIVFTFREGEKNPGKQSWDCSLSVQRQGCLFNIYSVLSATPSEWCSLGCSPGTCRICMRDQSEQGEKLQSQAKFPICHSLNSPAIKH